MVCKTCGSKLNDTDKFCRFCGTTVPAVPQEPVPQAPVFAPGYGPNVQAPQQPQGTYTPGQNAQVPQQPYAPGQNPQVPRQPQVTYTPGQNAYVPPQPAGGKKGAHLKAPQPKKPGGKPGKGLLIGGGIGAAVLVIVLVVVLLLAGSPAVKVATAFKNTAGVFEDMGKVWHLDEAEELVGKEAYSVSMEARLNTVSDDLIYGYNDALSGLGARVDMDVNLENRELGLLASANLGNTELITAMLSAEDEMLYFGAPDFLNDFYGVNTETLMKDLDDMGLGLGEAAQLRINLFDLIDIVREYTGDTEEIREELNAAFADLAKEITIEKDGKKNLKIGGESLKCSGYTVVIPQDALEDLLDVLEDVSDQDPTDMVRELCESIALPQELTEELLSELEYSYSQPDFEELEEALDFLGDVELQIYVKSGKIAGIVYEEKLDGTKVEIGAYVGGDRYGDFIELEMKVDGEKLTVEFEGDHFAKDGAFTDEMTVKIPYGNTLKLKTEYDPKSGALEMSCDVDSVEFSVEGIYTVADGVYTLDLDDIRMVAEGEMWLSLGFGCEITDYSKRVEVSNARLLTDLTSGDMESLLEEVEGNAMEWAAELMASHPEFLEYFGIY